jgi:hypothetical protein
VRLPIANACERNAIWRQNRLEGASDIRISIQFMYTVAIIVACLGHVGCGCGTESSRVVLRFPGCTLREVNRGSGAWDSFHTEYKLKCGDHPESTILAGRRLEGVKFREKDQHMVVTYEAGYIEDFSNYYWLDGPTQIEIDLQRVKPK